MTLPPLTLAYFIKQCHELEVSEQSFKHHQVLQQERDSLEEEMSKLKIEIDQNFYHFYMQEKTEEAFALFQKILKEKQKQLDQLKQMQAKLDHLLDQTEELTEENLEQQRAQLLWIKGNLNPSHQLEYESKQKELSHLLLLKLELQDIDLFLNHLSQQLHTAIQARQSIKGKGFLNYIFGISPNIVIEKQLLESHALILRFLPLVLKLIEQNQINEDIYIWLNQLKISCNSSWGFQHIDTIFSNAYFTTQTYLDQLRKQQLTIEEKIETLKNEIKEWLKPY